MAVQFIRGLFQKLANPQSFTAERPQSRVYNEPPVPVGDWGLVVDKNGDAVIGRPPDGNDFIALYPVQYHYKGTLPVPDAKTYSDRDKRAGILAEYAERNDRNRILLDKAVFLLSQTQDGRRLLHMAKEQKFSFAFDKDRTEKEGAAGICDYTNKLIPLAEGRTAEQVALTLKHELQHMEDISKGVSYSNHHSLRSSIMADRCLEANARVSEAVTCVEMLKGNDKGPERQFRTSALFACFFDKNRPMAARALLHMEKAQNSDWKTFAAKVFEGYYAQTDTLEYYDKRQADMYMESVPLSPEQVFDNNDRRYDEMRSHFRSKENLLKYGQQKLAHIADNDYWTHQQDVLKEKISVRGVQSYLLGADSPDLNDVRYANFSAKAGEKITAFINGVKRFIPHKAEHLETAMEMPKREDKPNTTITPSPFAGHHTAQESGFKAICFPERHGAISNHRTTRYDDITKMFADCYHKAGNYPETLDKFVIAIEGMRHEYRGAGNINAVMRDLVDSGLRVPVAALPEEYILELSRKLHHGAEKGDMSGLDKADLTLMQHWRDMARNGIDPVYGDDAGDKKHTLFHAYENAHYKHYIKPYIDIITAEMPAAKPALAQSQVKKAERV